MKLCTICGEREIEPNRFSYCRPCRLETDRKRWDSMSFERRASKWLKYKYGLTYEEFQRLHEKQNGQCAICQIDIHFGRGSSQETACVDHDHKTNAIRGLLCNHCNRALGLLNEDLKAIKRMESYIEQHSSCGA